MSDSVEIAPGELSPFEPELKAILSSLHGHLTGLNGEIFYVLRECNNANIPADVADRITKVFEAFFGTVQHDVRAEVLNLEDKLGLRPGLKPYDPDIKNPDPRVTIGFIRDWLHADFVDLDQLVKELKGNNALGYILVSETGANMLNIHGDIVDGLRRIESILSQHNR
ncbi:MAG: hypothetical protein K2Y31_06365 [Burkholderiales bacterium]|jgi:hypothetical protein|nr:hypothetical protein [Burkholderiales bacterium]